MKKLALSLVSIASIASLTSGAGAAPSSPTYDAMASACKVMGCTLSDFSETPYSATIRHESMEITFDPSLAPYEKIGIHHFRSTAVNVVANPVNVVMLHGDLFDFNNAFLEEHDSTFTALPGFLAGQNVDVWGIDLRWTGVPLAQADTDAMAGWGVEQDAEDVSSALGVIRTARGHLGNGTGPVNLLGWSRGGVIGYGLLNAESQLAEAERHVAGFIPVDIYLKLNDNDVVQQELKQRACNRAAANRNLLANGQWADATGALMSYVGGEVLAGNGGNPAPPPFGNLYTNLELAIGAGVGTYALLAPNAYTDAYHFTAPTIDANTNTVTGLAHTNIGSWFMMEKAAAPYQPLQEMVDTDQAICEDPNYPATFADNLADIAVPVMYVGARGGFGAAGEHTVSLLGSTDVSYYEISTDASEYLDFGHVDIFHGRTGTAAPWRMINRWLQSHTAAADPQM